MGTCWRGGDDGSGHRRCACHSVTLRGQYAVLAAHRQMLSLKGKTRSSSRQLASCQARKVSGAAETVTIGQGSNGWARACTDTQSNSGS